MIIREIVLDTETTGLSPRDGHRIVEIGALEMENKVEIERLSGIDGIVGWIIRSMIIEWIIEWMDFEFGKECNRLD